MGASESGEKKPATTEAAAPAAEAAPSSGPSAADVLQALCAKADEVGHHIEKKQLVDHLAMDEGGNVLDKEKHQAAMAKFAGIVDAKGAVVDQDKFIAACDTIAGKKKEPKEPKAKKEAKPKAKAPELGTKICIRNLAEEVDQAKLTTMFESFGKITKVEVKTKKDGKFEGFAFIQFASADEASKAMTEMNDKEVDGTSKDKKGKQQKLAVTLAFESTEEECPWDGAGEDESGEAEQWKVVILPPGSLSWVRQSKERDSAIIGAKKFGEIVNGVKQGDWLKLTDEPGYSLIHDRGEEALQCFRAHDSPDKDGLDHGSRAGETLPTDDDDAPEIMDATEESDGKRLSSAWVHSEDDDAKLRRTLQAALEDEAEGGKDVSRVSFDDDGAVVKVKPKRKCKSGGEKIKIKLQRQEEAAAAAAAAADAEKDAEIKAAESARSLQEAETAAAEAETAAKDCQARLTEASENETALEKKLAELQAENKRILEEEKAKTKELKEGHEASEARLAEERSSLAEECYTLKKEREADRKDSSERMKLLEARLDSQEALKKAEKESYEVLKKDRETMFQQQAARLAECEADNERIKKERDAANLQAARLATELSQAQAALKAAQDNGIYQTMKSWLGE